MGATNFTTYTAGVDSAEEVFERAVEDALAELEADLAQKREEYPGEYDDVDLADMALYSGGLPSKQDAEVIVVEADGLDLFEAEDLALRLTNEDPRFSDPAGPVGAIPVGDGGWVFFGTAKE